VKWSLGEELLLGNELAREPGMRDELPVFLVSCSYPPLQECIEALIKN
jgi:hypothetical protein